jgi:hypothetical protein
MNFYLTVELNKCSGEEAVVMLFVPLACINPVFADHEKMKEVRRHSLLQHISYTCRPGQSLSG